MFSLRYIIALGSFLISFNVVANELDNLDNLSLEDLLNLEVTSVSKKPERAFDTAAAIHILTDQDIKNSGATSVPEVLRLVPGVQVARINSHSWSITVRGFSGSFSTKLLVMIDGRSVYTPMFPGVYWDTQDLLLEDIKRIEVIRGSGGTLWGANAVNGVVNIITKRAAETKGAYARVTYGTEDRIAEARYGGNFSGDNFYRIYLKRLERDGGVDGIKNDLADDWDDFRSGFRVDFENDIDNLFTIQGDLYHGHKTGEVTFPQLTAPFTGSTNFDDNRGGGNLTASYTHRYDDGAETSIKTYYDQHIRSHIFVEQKVQTADLDMQHSFQRSNDHEFTIGAGYRFIKTLVNDSIIYDFTGREKSNNNLWTAFIQDKIFFNEDTFALTLGSKFEHNSFTGFEYQPTARFSYMPHPTRMAWGAISRTVRTPSNIEDHGSIFVATNSSGNSPVILRWQGNEDFDIETTISYELGFRINPNPNISYDFTAFHHDYDQQRSIEVGSAFFDTRHNALTLPLYLDNNITGESYGFEIGSKWNVNSDWTLSANYSFFTLDLHKNLGSTDSTSEADEGSSPKNQFNIHSNYRLNESVAVNNIIYYVDSLESGIDSYIRFDMNVIWAVTPNMSISLVGQNLFDDTHFEYGSTVFGDAAQVERALYGQFTWKF